jgi:hypothetical protein
MQHREAQARAPPRAAPPRAAAECRRLAQSPCMVYYVYYVY